MPTEQKTQRSLLCLLTYFLSICCGVTGAAMMVIAAREGSDIRIVLAGVVLMIVSALVVIVLIVRNNPKAMGRNAIVNDESPSA